ncbi:MAG: xylanase [Clostridia bacterium]|nr:xylanase [Clostridia bacterium]
MSDGAIRTGNYPNYLAEIGIREEEARARVEAAFATIFFDPEENFCHHTDEDAWCMVDTGNTDARTEGMSYGMMMCVQMDRKDIFDRLWTFSDRYMRMHEGPNAGYFAWSVQLDGKHNAEGPAPDGEEYFAMALLMASARWGDGEGLFDYSSQAREILRHVVHQKEMVPGGEPMWEPENHYIRFVPGMKISDPSYHLPHFYDLFALKADEEDREFWQKAAEASREYLVKSAHPVTGLSPEYADYDGKTVLLFRKPWVYYSDAYRVAENIALDHVWFGDHPEEDDVLTRLQDFFAQQDLDDLRAYELDGTLQTEKAMHPTAILAVLGAASIASRSEHREKFLRIFADTPLRKGVRRYYDNCLYFFCLLMLTGNYRIYI